ncbi:MAG: hypothetical protein FD123_528 [Bacteroidetes bacterium]|nr:MAG: hypothetical protein FD123_528 [Bacteroidota bacterium]
MKRLVVILVVLFPFLVSAQSPGTLQRISSTTGAGCYEVEYYNNYLLTGAGNTLMVYSTDTVAGTLVSMLTEARLGSNIADLKMFGTHVIVAANHDGVYMFGTSSLPASLQQEAHYLPDTATEAAYNLAIKGDTLFVAYKRKMAAFKLDTTGTPGITMIDRFGHLPSWLPNARVRGCDVKGNLLAYTVATYSANVQADTVTGVYLVDAAATGFPQLHYHTQTFADPEDVIFGINTNLLHVLGGTESYANLFDPSGIFYSLDVSNPQNPTQVYSRMIGQGALPYIQISQPMKAVNINDTIYVAALGAPDSMNTIIPAYGHTYIFRATASMPVKLINAVYAGLWHFDVAVNRKKMYVASEWYGIKTIDLATLPTGGTDLGNTLTGGWCKGGDRRGNRLLQANEGYGFRIYDISSPTNPQLMSADTINEFCWGASFSGDGQYVYGHYYSNNDFRVFNATTLAQVGSVNQFTAFVDPRRSRTWQHKAISIYDTGSDNLVVINAANPAAPFFELNRQYSGGEIDIAVDSTGGNLFVMSSDSISVYDITGNTFPLRASIAIPGGGLSNFKTIALWNDTVFAVVDHWLNAFDGIYKYYFNGTNQLTQVGGPYAMPVSSTVDLPKFAAADSFGVYIVYQEHDLYALRYGDLAQVGYHRHGREFYRTTDYGPQDLYCKEGFIFLAEYFGQTTMFSNDTGFILSQNQLIAPQFPAVAVFPNPAQESVTILLPPKASWTGTIILTNMLGQEIRREKITGSRQQLDVARLPEGLYVLRVEAGKDVFSEKLVIRK